jgi:pSer/pThr/pTyr-binding forkhead associated (FHA) protein
LKDFYELLGVGPEASAEEVRRAYRDRAQKAMWDRPHFAALSEAFDVLKDPNRRAEYDRRWRAAKGQAAAEEVAPPSPGMSAAAAAGVALPPPQSPRAAAASDEGRTQGVHLPPCPICGTPGVPGEQFCVECGFLAGSEPGTEPRERPLPRLVDVAGREYPLKPGTNTVGREAADVMLPDRTVSRRHAVVVVDPGGEVWLEDSGSTNGTQRAGRHVPAGQRAALDDGVRVQFGAVELILRIPDAPLALPLPDVEPERREPVAALNAPAAAGAEPATPPEPAAMDDTAVPAHAEEPYSAEPVAKLVGTNGQVYALTEKTTTFGRRSTNHFVLAGDPYVSGAHAQVVWAEPDEAGGGDGGAAAAGFRIIDMGSTNGTRLNGTRLEPNRPYPLADGDEVALGQTALRFHTRIGDRP